MATIKNSELEHLENIACGLEGLSSILDALSAGMENEGLIEGNSNCAKIMRFLVNSIEEHKEKIDNVARNLYKKEQESQMAQCVGGFNV